MKKYPFKFLDSYSQSDAEFFFGRDDETNALYEMVFQTSILLIYGTSGTGKTSLIQCGLASKFQSYDWLALNVRRGNNINLSLEKSLIDAGGNRKIIDDDHLEDGTVTKLTGFDKSLRAIFLSSFKPIYLIFDQFEELYILGTKDEQKLFIESVKQILQVKQPVKIIISVREEYLGYLYEFEKEVPQLMRKKLRVEPMNQIKVEEVIKSICSSKQSLISLKAGQEDEIAKVIYEKIRGDEKIPSIQLPYLQVFLDSFYLKITNDETRKSEAVFTLEALNKIGNIGDVLRNFLDEQVLTIANKLDQKPETIWKILTPFVTLEGTKEPLSSKKLSDQLTLEPKDIIEKALNAFLNSRILRFTDTNQMYEIAHDSLAKQINAKRSDEEIAILEVQRLIKSQVSIKNEAKEYFTERQLLFIDPYLNRFKISELEKEWIAKSKEQIRANKEVETQKQERELVNTRKRLNTVRILLALALVALLAGGYFFIIAQKEKEKAELEKKNALENLKKAKKSENERVSIEIDIATKNKIEFEQFRADKEILNLSQAKIDSLCKLVEKLDAEIDTLEYKLNENEN